MSVLRVRGARAGNLQGVDLDLPHGAWTAIHGPSGAGKSALLFGVLAPLARERFRVLADPRSLPGPPATEGGRAPAARVEGLRPILAWAGEVPRARRRAEVGEVLALWPLLAVAAGSGEAALERVCPRCGSCWRPATRDGLLAELEQGGDLRPGEALFLYSAVAGAEAAELLRGGWTRVWRGGELLRIEDGPEILPEDAWLLLDRFRWQPERRRRLADGLELALGRDRALRLDCGERSREWPAPRICPACGAEAPARPVESLMGLREADDLRVGGRSWSAWGKAPLEDWTELPVSTGTEGAARRLRALLRTGLGHLHARRRLGSLSLGESRRMELAVLLAQVRREQLILFDEPGMGLHGSERCRLAELLHELAAQGNTVLTADPAREFLERADHWVRLGPGGGPDGGRVVARGTRAELPPCAPASGTDGRSEESSGASTSADSRDRSLIFRDLRARHLAIPELRLPLGRLVVFAGVSGSGKTTLLETLTENAGDQVSGKLPAGGVVVLLERALGSAARSTIATLSGTWEAIRRSFAQGEEGRIRGLRAGDLVAAPGRGGCSTCRGLARDEAGFPCPDCEGLGLRQDLLALRLRGRSLREWLTTPLARLERRLPSRGRLRDTVGLLVRLGLGERRLGERGRHLSLGERGRIALARELARARADRPRLFLLDEPCLGLPPDEALRVVEVFRELLAVGHSLWVVEHHETMLRAADHLVELGPGAGPHGGRLLYAGPPSGIVGRDTPTGRWLERRARPRPVVPPPSATSTPPREFVLPDGWDRRGRLRLEADLLRELATRSPLASDQPGDLLDLGGSPRLEDTPLPPVAWPTDPPPRSSLLAILGLDRLLADTLRDRGEAVCAACGGLGPWPDLATACAAAPREGGPPPGELLYTTPAALPGGASGAEGAALLRAAGFRRIFRGGAPLSLLRGVGLEDGDEILLDRFDLARERDPVPRLRELEHHSRLLGKGILHGRSAADPDPPVWIFRAGRCRSCGRGSAERAAAMEFRLGGWNAADYATEPLGEALLRLREHAGERGADFGRALEFLGPSSLLSRPGATPWSALTFLERRWARFLGWLLFPVEGLILLHDQPLSALGSKLTEIPRHRVSGFHRYTDPEGDGVGGGPARCEPYSLAFRFEDWAEPPLADREGSLREALGLVEPLRRQYLACEEARLRGWGPKDLGRGPGARRCPHCRGARALRPHPELFLACPACEGSGWAPECAALEIRGLSWRELGRQPLARLAEHFADTPELAGPLRLASAFGMGRLPLDADLRRLPLGVASLAPLAARLAAHPDDPGPLRLAYPLAGLPPGEARRVAEEILRRIPASCALEWRENGRMRPIPR